MARRRLLVTTCLLLGATLSGCGVDLTGLDLSDVDLGMDAPNPLPPDSPVNPAIAVQLLPRLSDSVGQVFGTIRDGSYIDSLRVRFVYPNHLILWAGVGRSGTYDVTIAAPGYATWDTTGVWVPASSYVVYTKNLSVQLVETPD